MKSSQLTLPLFLTQANKWVVFIVVSLIAVFLYMGPNHFPITARQTLPFWSLDKSIPFLPYTVWVYISEYTFFSIAYLASKDVVNCNKYIYSFMAQQLVSISIFWLWPTTYPRHLFPLPTTLDPVTYFVFDTLRHIDDPSNCCPSLHVSSVFLTSFIFIQEQRKKFVFFFLWGLAIAISTLTTKQHYVVDVLTGFASATIFYTIFHRLVQYRPFSYFRLATQGAQANR